MGNNSTNNNNSSDKIETHKEKSLILTVGKIVRIVTIPPVLALVLAIVIQICRPEVFNGSRALICCIVFLSIFPVLAYPLQKVIPGYKDKGRDGQRTLAMIFAVVGYVLGLVSTFVFESTTELRIIYMQYLLSCIILVFTNKCLHLLSSGHACATVGPFAILIFMKLYQVTIPGIIIILIVFWSSLITKRHTVSELAVGSVVPFIAMGILKLAMNLLGV